MEPLQDVWPLIAANPWPFLALALLVFGFGWGAARLLYGERLELLKEKAGNPTAISPATSKEEAFSYPSRGRYGPNLLSNVVQEIHVGETLSLDARVPEGASLHVVLKGLPPMYVEDASAGWTFSAFDRRNWAAGSYHQDMQGAEQHFNAEKGTAELKLYMMRAGDLTVQITEEGAGGNNFTKMIRVRASALPAT